MTVRVVHDFTCPWCWVGLFQAQRLQKEFGVDIEWVGAELWPEELGWPAPRIPEPEPENKPALKSRFEFLKFIEGIEVPKIERPKWMRIHKANLAVELAKHHGVADAMVEALYRAYWERGEAIGEFEVIEGIAASILPSDANISAAIESEEGAANILHFDDPAHEAGVYNVPTFFIGQERLAEQPYGELSAAVERARQSQLD